MRLESIAELIEGLEVSADRTELQAAFALRDRLDAAIAVAVADYEAAGLHEVDGSGSITAWLRRECGRDGLTARRVASVGRKLRALPVLRDAVMSGAVSGGHLDAVCVNVPERHLARFADHEAGIVAVLVDLTADQTRRVMATWRQRADAIADAGPPVEHPNEVYLDRTLDDRGELRGSFDADLTAVLEAALRVADPNDLERPAPVRRADALAQICQHFLDNQRTRRGGRHRPHLNVTITDRDLAAGIGGRYLDTDQPVSPAGLGVLTCDSVLHRFVFDAPSGRIDYGRATRTWPVDIYNAIALRDGGCRFGTCDAPPSWCDVHHVEHWEHGGTTSVDNGIMGCRRHHRLAHQPGHHVKLLPDGTVKFTHPDGRVETSQPRCTQPLDLWTHRPPDGS